MRNEIITGYRPELVKTEPAKDTIVILNFNVVEGEESTYTSDSVSFKMSQAEELPELLESEGIIEAVQLDELLVALNALNIEEEKAIEISKKILLKQIELYDLSPNVNSFVLEGQSMWLDKATRVGLMNSITIEKNSGRDTTTLWLGNNKFQFPVDVALQMLSMIELYALECYNVTSKHLVDVANASSLDFVSSYDITQDYPEPPVMEL